MLSSSLYTCLRYAIDNQDFGIKDNWVLWIKGDVNDQIKDSDLVYILKFMICVASKGVTAFG